MTQFKKDLLPKGDPWTHYEIVDQEKFTIKCSNCNSINTLFVVTNYPEGTTIYLWCKDCGNNAILY